MFIKNVSNKFGIDISHLSKESVEHENNIKHPIIFSRQNVSDVINEFDKVLVEGIDICGLRSLYEQLISPTTRDRNYTNWQSIKLIEGILYGLSEAAGLTLDIKSLMSPLYILHDYRILLDHLLAEEKQTETKNL